MSARVEGQVAVVAGAAGAVGQSVCQVLTSEGAKVIGIDIRARPEARSNNDAVIHVQGDVTAAGVADAVVAKAVETFGKLDILVNAAGVMHDRDAGVEALDTDVLAETMKHNLVSIVRMCCSAIPVMRQSGGGAIVNVASLVGLRGSPVPQLAYTAAKGAVIAFSRELAVAYAGDGIRVNTVCPGALYGGLMRSRLARIPEVRRREAETPLKRLGRPEDVATACLFLASREAIHITGIELVVDGGSSAASMRPTAAS